MSTLNYDLGSVEALVRLAVTFGPFLFAILFTLLLVTRARSWYVACMTRRRPPPTEQEQKTYRLYFLSTVWAGFIFTGLCTGWWLYANTRTVNVYQFAVVALRSDEKILSDYFSKDIQRPTIGDVAPLHDSFFVLVQDRPLQPGDQLSFQYFKLPTDPAPGGTSASSNEIQIKYSGGNRLTYRVAMKPEGPSLEATTGIDIATKVFTAEEITAAKSRYARAGSD